MHFLRYIDKIKSEFINNSSIIDSDNFHFYIEIEFIGINLPNKIICLKNKYSNILIETKSEIKIYLDDYDIVSMLVNLLRNHNKIGQAIINSMYKLIKGEGQNFSFKIQEEEFNFKGLPINNSGLSINTKADIEISVAELIMVINLIFEKEKIKSSPNVMESIIYKYICLTEYYGSKNIESKQILDELKFRTDKNLDENKSIIAWAGPTKFVVASKTFLKYKKSDIIK